MAQHSTDRSFKQSVAFGAAGLLAAVIMLSTGFDDVRAQSGPKVSHFKLKNGMQVVVVPDHRAPVVTHMVWYRTGAADEPAGKSGIAHFLEHLMFKSTKTIKSGEFSKIVSRLGGQDNAFTSQDATAYFQRVAKEHLATFMQMEADRMVNLQLTEKEVKTERDVILEERRSRTDNSPAAILGEQMGASLYLNHPYRIPVIGWAHEIAKLNRKDALDFYKFYYAPNNAILVVTGDVTGAEVKKLAQASYGKLPSNPAIEIRQRPSEPPQVTPRYIVLKDQRAGKASIRRHYLVPSYKTAEPGEAEALDLLAKIGLSGSTSRLYRALVVDGKQAASAGGWYEASGLDMGRLGVSAIAADGVSLDTLEAAIDKVIQDLRENGITDKELTRAKKLYMADYIYESDSQSQLARRYGWALVVGRSLKDIEEWPERISKVTKEDIQNVARKYFDMRNSVTGRLLPDTPNIAAPNATKKNGKKASAKNGAAKKG